MESWYRTLTGSQCSSISKEAEEVVVVLLIRVFLVPVAIQMLARNRLLNVACFAIQY
jgi:hypothetical protein